MFSFGILWASVRCIYIRCSPFGTLWDVYIVFISDGRDEGLYLIDYITFCMSLNILKKYRITRASSEDSIQPPRSLIITFAVRSRNTGFLAVEKTPSDQIAEICRFISRVERKTGVSQMVVFPQT